MTSEIDFYRAAQLLIKEHGDQAPSQAQLKIAYFKNKGDYSAVYTWKKISTAIAELQLELASNESIN